jgi:hypothetical protein
MDSINGLTRILHVIRRRFAEGASRSPKQDKKKIRNDEIKYTKPLTTSQLEQLIVTKIENLDRKEQDYYTKAATIFVESVLSWEFGEHIFDSSQFCEISHQIQKEILNTPDLSQKLALFTNQCSKREL